jgi:hypothetical protein
MHGLEPETLTKAFAERTEAKMVELRKIWRRAIGTVDFTPFVTAD